MKYESYNQYGELIGTHRTAQAAANQGCAYIVDDNGTRKRIYEGTTEDIVRGKIDISRIIDGNNHRLLSNGTVATTCVDGHDEITRISEDGRCYGYYDVLYV